MLICAALLATTVPASAAAAPPSSGGAGERVKGLDRVIPAPASVTPADGHFTLDEDTPIRLGGTGRARAEARGPAGQLAALLRPSTGYALPVTAAHGEDGLRLRIVDELPAPPGGAKRDGLGAEGYRLTVDENSADLSATTRAGLLNGIQTLRQLLPDRAESRTAQDGPWRIAAGTVVDEPRYAYRGAHLDVSRHFFGVGTVKKYIDRIAMYKLNKLHLHLSDDQGWRIAVKSWPRLTEHGGKTEVGGGPGGYYTQAQYRDIVRYAAARNVTVVPEIDMPGHTNAALSSYAELNCDGVAPPPYTGIEVGFSSLCVGKEITYDFVDDVVREIARLTPGPYLHIGGDEAHSTDKKDYAAFMARAQRTVAKYGKTVVGWHQLTGAGPAEGAIAQYWGTEGKEKEVVEAAKNGTRLILSPANRAYLDMKYNKDTPYGLDWAGHVETRQSYDWDPGSYFKGVPEEAVHGVEAALWTERIESIEQIDYMAFPRLPGIAELGWSPADTHDWADYRERLAQQAPRWDALGITYWRSPQVPWPDA
nr:beta-N-acetylhexosaminidase [Streptomyces sp. HNM0574]